MTNQKGEPHPLDDDALNEDALDSANSFWTSETPSSESRAYKPLLKPGTIFLIGGAIVAFLAGVLATNASARSTAENVGSFVNRLGVGAMLIGAVCILLAYRIDYLKRLPFDTSRWLLSSFSLLVAANLIVLALVWGGISLLLPQTVAMVNYFYITIFSGLLVTMFIWHKNFLRAYAVGALTAYLPMGLIAMWGLPRGANSGVFFGVSISLIMLTGIVCAGYVKLLTLFENSSMFSNLKSSDSDRR